MEVNHGKFIWADLSTYNVPTSENFYSKAFDWQMENRAGYRLAYLNNNPIAGIFETPTFLQKINMPHFWMSYFQVNSTEKTVALAKSLNAKVEVDTTNFNDGNIALIRDPQGAGFTIYDGSELYFGPKRHGSIVKTELHVSEVKTVLPFYAELFNWKYSEKDNSIYDVLSNRGNSNIQISELENDTKGKYEYWVTIILVKNLIESKNRILENGGLLVSDETSRIMMTDNSGEAFFYIEEED